MEVGTKVTTSIDNHIKDPKNWMVLTCLTRQAGLKGVIVRKHEMPHGMPPCWDVRHDDSKWVGCYEEHELNILETGENS